MKRKRKKTSRSIFATPEERVVWEQGYIENMHALRVHAERIKAELAAKGTPYKAA
jgi:hypothetical protein